MFDSALSTRSPKADDIGGGRRRPVPQEFKGMLLAVWSRARQIKVRTWSSRSSLFNEECKESWVFDVTIQALPELKGNDVERKYCKVAQ